MSHNRAALLCTADGVTFRGVSVGATETITGEVVFNTSMTGYQEIITDPSYAGQVVVMTTAHVGNYGMAAEDDQAGRPALSGFVMRSVSRRDSNWRSEGSLGGYLRERGVTAVSDIDTRRLTRHIRDRGAMPVAIGVDVDEAELAAIASSAPRMEGLDLATGVSTSEPYRLDVADAEQGLVVAIDLGIKRDILTNLTSRGLAVQVVPAGTGAVEILEARPNGVFVSNGPGDPEPLAATISTLRGLLGRVPIFGICLGHQVLGLAAGARTFKLPFGHHGGNHPVRRLSDGRVYITAQNHGFAVDLWSMTELEPPPRNGLAGPDLLPPVVVGDFGELVPTHQNLNDGSLEGMVLPEAKAFSVQYHPEAAPGPLESTVLFDEFVTLMELA